MEGLDAGADVERRRWPRELLLGLLLTPPLLALVFEPDGMRHPLVHQLRSLSAIWLYVMTLGLAIQLATDAVEARRPGTLDGPLGTVRHVALVWLLVGAVTTVLALPLVWTCPGLDGRMATLALRGVLLATAYVLLGRLYRSFVRTREEAAAARALADRQLAEARYATLMARTQPHFLHNALAAAAGMVPRDPVGAERILRDLGSLFREIVQGTDKRRVRAADELDTARHYLTVQELRFAPRLEVHIEVEALAEDELVPPLVLLPFVENAVLHGLSDGGVTHVRVMLDLEPDHVLFRVEDDGPGLGASKHDRGAGVGTEDARSRLETLYGDEASITTGPLAPGTARPGHMVELRIPREDE